jgi:hypothetical protein
MPKAELLARSGTLTGWLGSAKQIPGAQEVAKDLISESAGIFESIWESEKVAEAQVDLAICYWREGGLDEARVTLRLFSMISKDSKRAEAEGAYSIVHCRKSATRDQDALRIYTEAAPLFDQVLMMLFKGKFHNSTPLSLRSLGTSEKTRRLYRSCFG